jgi:uncharacterized protein
MKTLMIFCMTVFCLTALPFGAVQADEKSACDFVVLMTQKEFDKAAALFDTNMKKAVTPTKLGAIWKNQLRATGAFQKICGTRSEVLGAYRAVFVTCRFAKQQLDVKVVFDNTGKIAGMFFVPTQKARYQTPEYVDRDTFKETDIQIGSGQWALPGTLSVPISGGPFPAVIFVHGSGPQDRDASIGPNKPFRDLAWGLASKGIVVLRYEKRTRQYAASFANSIDNFTVREETVADALEAVSLLQRNGAVRADRIFVLGHSLGGMLIPRIGRNGSAVAGFIAMAANARPLEDLILEQTLFQASLATDLTTESKRAIMEVKKQVAAIKDLDGKSAPGTMFFGAPSSYWLDLKGYRPAAAAKAIERPMLIMQGEADCQVNRQKDFEEWRRALSDKKDVAFKLYPMLNHLFMEVNARSTGAEYQQPGNVAAAVVSDIAGWINRHR